MAICLVSFVALAVFYFSIRGSAVLVPFLGFNARLASLIVNLFGASTWTAGPRMLSATATFYVSPECTSIIPTGVFVSTVLAWPSSFRWKLVGIGMGVGVFFVINLIRVVSLYYISRDFPNLLDIAHLYVWGLLTVVFIVALWYLWARRVLRSSTDKLQKAQERTRGTQRSIHQVSVASKRKRTP